MSTSLKFEYEIGQKVCYMKDNSIVSSTIRARRYEDSSGGFKISYVLENGTFSAKRLFSSPQELAEMLVDSYV